MNWKLPTNVSEVHSFLGLAGYYRKFVEGFSKIATSLSNLLKKDQKFEWSDTCQQSFEEMRSRLTTVSHPTSDMGETSWHYISMGSSRPSRHVLKS